MGGAVALALAQFPHTGTTVQALKAGFQLTDVLAMLRDGVETVAGLPERVFYVKVHPTDGARPCKN